MADNPFMAAPAASPKDDGAYGFMTPFMEGAQRAIAKRGTGLIQLGMEATGLNETYPETYAASQRAIDKLEAQPMGGASGFVGEVLGDPLTAALAPIGMGGKAITMAAKGAGFGAAEGLTGGIGEGESRGYETIKSTAGGAVFAPVAGKGLQALGSAADPVLKFISRNVDDVTKISGGALQSLKRTIGALDDDVTIGVKSGIGADDYQAALADISADAVKSFRGATAKGVDPRAAYLDEVFKSKGGRMTAGQLGQDPNLQRLEDYARQGLLSGKAKNLARASEEQNLEAMRSWAGDVLNKYGVDAGDIDKTTVSSKIASSIKDAGVEAKGIANRAYDAGRKTSSTIDAEIATRIPQKARQFMREQDIAVSMTTPQFQKDFKLINRLLSPSAAGKKEIKVPTLFKVKQRMNNRAQWKLDLETAAIDDAQKESIRAYRALSYAVNEDLDDIITNKLINNPDEFADILNKAPALYKDYKQRFFGNDGKSAIGIILKKDLSDKEVVNYLTNAKAQKTVGQLKNIFGEDSKEIGLLRGMHFNEITKGALTTGDGIGSKGFGVALKSNWDKMQKENKSLVDELYTTDMQRQINDFVEAAFLQSNKIKSATNPAGSAIAFMDGWLRLMNNFGQGGGMMRDIAVGIAKAATAGADSRTAVKSTTNAVSLLGNNSSVIRDALTRSGVVAGATGVGKFMPAQKGFGEQSAPESNPFMQPHPQTNPFLNMQNSAPLAPQSSVAPEFFQKLAQAESSGNIMAKNPNSSASGLYQFTDNTWNDVIKKYGEPHGITKEMKNNPYAQEKMVRYLTEENRLALIPALGREPTQGELYIAHFMGAPKAKSILSKRGSRELAARVFPKEAKSNKPIFFDGKRPRTVQEVIAILERKVS